MKDITHFLSSKLNINTSKLAVRFLFLGLLSMLFVCNVAFANSDESTPKIKVGTNILSLLLIGDINGSLEYKLRDRFSFVSTAHYVGSSDLVTAEGEGYRVSAGIRTYGKFQNTEFGMMEFKVGLSRYSSGQGNSATSNNAPLSIEFYGGISEDFNEYLYYEFKIGLIRFLQSGNVSLGGGYNIGFKF